MSRPGRSSTSPSIEDGPRRLQRRLQRLLGGGPPPDDLHLATAWPRVSEGCIDSIEAWLDRHRGARLVILDTIVRVRDGQRHASASESDYDLVAAFKDLGDRRGCCVVVIHHTRKPRADGAEEGPFDTISGTLGLGGAADVINVLKRANGALDGKLCITGRDVEERDLPLLWGPVNCLWSVNAEGTLSVEQQRIVRCLTEGGRPMTPLEVTTATGRPHEATKKLLRRMSDQGLIVSERGRYSPLTSGQDVPDVPGDRSPFPD
jgi:hypothetical protein